MSAHKSRRCSSCNAQWPLDAKEYEPCPECCGHTWKSTQEPMLNAEAWTRKTHAEFERWLDEHDRRGPVEELERIPVRDDAAV